MTSGGDRLMRFRIDLAPYKENGRSPLLEYNYQHQVASMFYHFFDNIEHEVGEIHHKKGYKFYTFSRLEIPSRKVVNDGLLMLSNDAYLWFSCVDDNVALHLAREIVQSKTLMIGNISFAVLGVQLVESFQPTNDVVFSTMSPILLRTTREENGRTRSWDLEPGEPEFITRLSDNLHRKYEFYYGKRIDGNLAVKDVKHVRSNRIRIKDTFHRANLMHIHLEGEPELLQFAYDCGLGEKNSMGFGMVRVEQIGG